MKPAHEALLLLGILAASFLLYRENADFPLGLHVDEPGKARSALDGVPGFRHPQLLYRATRVAAAATGATSLQQVAEAGRLASALFGTGIVAASFALFRRRLGGAASLAASALLAATPLLAVHAHYLKEDTAFAFATTLAAIALLRFERERSGRARLLLGLATGLAVSAKYAGVVLFVPYLLLPLVLPIGDRKAWTRSIGVVALVAVAVFALIDAALFESAGTFLADLHKEARHAAFGHDVPIWGPSYGFGFHLVHSLVPGLGAGVTLAALAGVAWAARRGSRDDRILLLLLATFYLAIEISPTKPFPDFMRYALPLAPLLIFFAARGIAAFCARWQPRPTWAGAALIVALGIWPAWRTHQLVSALADDTRFAAAERVRALPGTVLVDDYSAVQRSDPQLEPAAVPYSLWSPEEIAQARWAVISSFRYERYLVGEGLPFQTRKVGRIAARYRRLLACPDQEIIQPRYESFAFSNPTIRIIDLESCRSALR
jgi:4-amino-4-deoxy-L-arabinose transferase-like glycosyltransferase